MGRACRAVVGVYAADGAGAVRFHPRESANDEVDPLMSLIAFTGIADRAKLYGCSRRVRFFSVFGS